MWGSIDGLQRLIEGVDVTHVSITLCPLSKSSPLIILYCPIVSLECTAGSLVCSLGSLIIRFCKQTIVAGVFLFEQLLDFLICFMKTVCVSWLTGQQLQPWFPVVWSSSASTVPQSLQLSHSEVFPPTRLGDCFLHVGHEVCALAVSLSGDCFSPLGHEVCAHAVSSSWDLSSWEETWR